MKKRTPRGSGIGYPSEATLKIVRIAAVLAGIYLVAAWIVLRLETGNEEASIRTYYDALWYTLATASTVGYGDVYPVSNGGRIVGSLIIVASVGLIGFVIGKFGEYILENNRRKFLGMNGTDFTGHYVVIGWSELARIVIQEMIAAGFRLAILADSEKDIAEMRSVFDDPKNFFVTYGIHEDDEAFTRLNIAGATGAIILSEDDTTTLVTVLHLKQLNPELTITAYIRNSRLKRTIENAGVNYVISPNEIVGRMIASAAFEPDVSSFLENILSTTTSDADVDVQEFRLREGHELIGKSVVETMDILATRFNSRFLTYSRRIDGRWRVVKVPENTERLQPEDHLIVLANHTAGVRLSEYLGVRQGRMLRNS